MVDPRYYVLLDVTVRDVQEHPQGHTVIGWYPVVDDQEGIIAYFANEEIAMAYAKLRNETPT